MIQVLERETKIHIHKFKPLKSKTIRLQTVAPLFEAGRVKFIDGAYIESFFKEIVAFPHVPHDDRTDATVWALTYFQHHMDARGAEYANAFSRVGSTAGRSSMFGEFTELKRDGNKNRGRRSMFGQGSAGEQYRLGAEGRSTRRSSDLRFDQGM